MVFVFFCGYAALVLCFTPAAAATAPVPDAGCVGRSSSSRPRLKSFKRIPDRGIFDRPHPPLRNMGFSTLSAFDRAL